MIHIFICVLIILFFWCLQKLLNIKQNKDVQKDVQKDINKDNMWIVIDPMWGLCNRLRTIRVAHDLAKQSGRKLAIIDEKQTHRSESSDEFKTMFSGASLEDLFTSPHLSFWSREELNNLKASKHLNYNTKNDCSYETSLDDFKKLIQPVIIIKACGLIVKGLEETDEFYTSIVPTKKVMEKIQDNLSKIYNNLDRVVGVHIRQGTIADYHKGNFFGKWEKDTDPKNIPIKCCGKNTNKDPMCPQNAPSVDMFVEKMHTFPKNTLFFICSDRPGCYFWLQEEFPNRIMHNKVEIEYEANAFNAFCDWFCLGQCKNIIVTNISSFSGEAAKLTGSNVINI